MFRLHAPLYTTLSRSKADVHMADAIDPTEQTQPDDPRSSIFVVGLGASAGGIKALKEFFAHVAPKTEAAYAVILHLSPDHDSRLAEVLQAATPLPVAQV